jgi:hypothetical protein
MRAQGSSAGIGFGMTMAGGGGGFSVPDTQFEAAADCFVCDKKFHAFRRKHRCKVQYAVCDPLPLDRIRASL